MVTQAEFDLMDEIKELKVKLSKAEMAVHSHGIIGFELGRLSPEKLKEVIARVRGIGINGDTAFVLIDGINGDISAAQVISFLDKHPTFEMRFSS